MPSELESTTTERLLLRAFREGDAEAIFRLRSDPATSQFIAAGPMRTVDEARKVLALWLDDWARTGVGYWAVERREAPGAVVGFCGVRHRELEGQHVLNLGYRFLPETWGSGYATEAARATLAAARQHVPGVPIVAVIHEQNAASLRVVERLGMRLDRAITYEGAPSRLYVAP